MESLIRSTEDEDYGICYNTAVVILSLVFLCFLIEFDTNLSNSFAYIILYQYIFYMSL